MDVRLSATQEVLKGSVTRVAERLGPRAVQELDDEDRAARLEAAVTESGWRELRAATETGEPLASGVEVAVVAEELARRLADTAFVGPSLAVELRRLARAEPSSSLETVALLADLSGLASVTDGALPHGAVGLDAKGPSAALALVGEPGGQGLGSFSLGKCELSVDLTRPNAVLGPGAVLSPVAAGRVLNGEDISRWTAFGLAVACADLVGTMRGALDLAVGYAKARRQYGAVIGTFQAVQHLLADALVAIEGSHSVALHAAWAVDALEPAEALYAASVAKAYCSRSALSVCETAIQVHGGIGNTWDCLAHVYLRRSLTSIDLLGGIAPSIGLVKCRIGVNDGLR